MIKYLDRKRWINWFMDKLPYVLSDESFLKVYFKWRLGYNLNLENPKTFNEKLQWLKLYYRKPIFTSMVDKYEAKKIVSEIIGEQYVVPTIGVWDNFDNIDFNSLPNQFVLKTTHGSGGVVICKDKSTLDLKKIRSKINKSLKRNYSRKNKEYVYENVTPRIIAENLLINENPCDDEIHDYKFYCFDGKMEFMLVSNDRSKGDVKFDYYDRDFNHLPFTQGGENYPGKIEKPKNFDLMVSLAEKLSKGIPHVRVDFYDVNGRVYFGELTFFDSSGFAKFEPAEWDLHWGNKIKLPNEKIV